MIKQEKWEIEIQGKGYIHITRDIGFYKEEVCSLYGHIRGTKENGALVDNVTMQDARMIAAAPAMYALLREFFAEEYEHPRLQKLMDVLNLVEGNAKL